MTAVCEVIDQPLKLVIPSDITNIETVQQLQAAAGPYFNVARELMEKATGIVVMDASDTASMEAARDVRLKLKKVRTSSQQVRETIKADALAKGKAIDAVFNGLRDRIATVEEYLQGQEDFAERLAAEKRAELKAERDATLIGMGVDIAFYNTADMSEQAFADCIAGIEAQQKAAAERAAKTEADRVAAEKQQAEAREAQRAENERLKAESAEREKVMQAERAAANAAAEQARKEREAIEGKAKAEREAAERVAADERKKREAAESKLREQKAEADRIAKAEAAAAKKAAKAPDAKKIKAYAESLRGLAMPECKEREARELVAWIELKVASLAVDIDTRALEL